AARSEEDNEPEAAEPATEPVPESED
ncbi:MAG: hypothetical protein A07HR67_01031, partial [uncultured archaeon A07HR67]